MTVTIYTVIFVLASVASCAFVAASPNAINAQALNRPSSSLQRRYADMPGLNQSSLPSLPDHSPPSNSTEGGDTPTSQNPQGQGEKKNGRREKRIASLEKKIAQKQAQIAKLEKKLALLTGGGSSGNSAFESHPNTTDSTLPSSGSNTATGSFSSAADNTNTDT